MLKVTKKVQAAAKSLAIAYNAYHRAIDEDDHNGVVVWSKSLNEAQAKLGIELSPTHVLETMYETHKRQRDAKERLANV